MSLPLSRRGLWRARLLPLCLALALGPTTLAPSGAYPRTLTGGLF